MGNGSYQMQMSHCPQTPWSSAADAAPPSASLFLGRVDGGPEKLAEELDSLGRVIIARDRVSDEARVAVGVHNAHRGDVHLGSIPHSHMGLKDIVERVQEDDEVRQADCEPKEEVCVSQQTTLEVSSMCERTLRSPGLSSRSSERTADSCSRTG